MIFLNLTVLNETQPHCDFSYGEMPLEINKPACFPQHNSFLVNKSIKLFDVKMWYLGRFLENERLDFFRQSLWIILLQFASQYGFWFDNA